MKNMNHSIVNPIDQTQQRITNLENKVRILNNTLAAFFLKGRLRTDRTAPVDSDDVQTPDLLYDRVVKDDYEYILIDDAGMLKWRRISVSMF